MSPPPYRITLAGNPNVGKSTIFNALTGLRQHTGNWVGKTVENAKGALKGYDDIEIIDLPGTYSLSAHSGEEECAGDYLFFGEPDCTVIIADATALERNLNLALQITEITDNAVLCVNLLDEAARGNIRIDFSKLEELMGIPVVGTTAKTGDGINALIEAALTVGSYRKSIKALDYPRILNDAVNELAKTIPLDHSRLLAHKLLENNGNIAKYIAKTLPIDDTEKIFSLKEKLLLMLGRKGITAESINDMTVNTVSARAKEIASQAILNASVNKDSKALKLDKALTKKYVFVPLMLILLSVIFYITLTGANYPSGFLMTNLFKLEDALASLLNKIGAPPWLTGSLIHGGYRTLAWVVSVMLPPMAIFFPLFTLLEDSGFLPRIAFNLDSLFRRANTCGKQALTMCMGFGCNAVGVTGARIINSPRERLIAVVTNSFVPCNGRFPLIITVSGLFFAAASGFTGNIISSLILTAVIFFAVLTSFAVSFALSKTVLRGVPSAFILELPPYRMPQIGKTIVRSVFDKTLNVLGRAAMVAFPAGIVIWCLANISTDGVSILEIIYSSLDPVGRFFGVDGVILMAFLLGFPANEIVIPIMIMCYTASGVLADAASLQELQALFATNGWTALTAINTIILCLNHFPCSTTCLTIKKETKSVFWTLVSMLLPLVVGLVLMLIVRLAFGVLGIS